MVFKKIFFYNFFNFKTIFINFKRLYFKFYKIKKKKLIYNCLFIKLIQ